MGVLSSIGKGLNKLTGASNSAKTQFEHQMALQKDAQEFAKWQMQNAHQTEVQDLQNAGLNPVLSANNGASAGVTEGSASAGTPAGDPISMISNLITAMNSAKQTEANVQKIDSEIKNIDQDTKNKGQEYELNPKVVKALTELQNAQTAKTYAEKKKIAQDIIESQVRTIGQDIANKMGSMDLNKRKQFWETELEVAKKDFEAQLVYLGFESDETVKAVERAFETVGKVFGGSVTHGYNTSNVTSKSTSKSKSEVGVRNLDYNPVRHQAIGF